MSIRSLMNKQKLFVDDITSVLLMISVLLLASFFQLIAIMSFIVYPISTLFLYGIYRTCRGIFNKQIATLGRIVNLIVGLFSVIFSTFILIIVFGQPHIPIYYVIYFLSLPIILIGIAGVMKGVIVRVYSPLHRRLNIFIGLLTVLFSFIAIFYAHVNFFLNLFSLLIMLGLNGLFRSALYLSEFGLSIKQIKNFRLVFFIMNEVPLKNQEILPYDMEEAR